MSVGISVTDLEGFLTDVFGDGRVPGLSPGGARAEIEARIERQSGHKAHLEHVHVPEDDEDLGYLELPAVALKHLWMFTAHEAGVPAEQLYGPETVEAFAQLVGRHPAALHPVQPGARAQFPFPHLAFFADTQGLYLPVPFERPFPLGPVVIGSIPSLAAELAALEPGLARERKVVDGGDPLRAAWLHDVGELRSMLAHFVAAALKHKVPLICG